MICPSRQIEKIRSSEVAKLFRHLATSLFRCGILVFVITFLGCDGTVTPKPRGYFRIDVPQHQYRAFDSTYPFLFDVPVYAVILADTSSLAEPGFMNVLWPDFNAQLHVSYKKVDGNLAMYIDDAFTLVNKHIPKASAISQQEYINSENKVFGLTYEIRGADAASPYQFYLTDSTHHFLRGALYFNLVPNNDSLQPVIEFLKEDVQHIISTLRWKKS